MWGLSLHRCSQDVLLQHIVCLFCHGVCLPVTSWHLLSPAWVSAVGVQVLLSQHSSIGALSKMALLHQLSLSPVAKLLLNVLVGQAQCLHAVAYTLLGWLQLS